MNSPQLLRCTRDRCREVIPNTIFNLPENNDDGKIHFIVIDANKNSDAAYWPWPDSHPILRKRRWIPAFAGTTKSMRCLITHDLPSSIHTDLQAVILIP